MKTSSTLNRRRVTRTPVAPCRAEALEPRQMFAAGALDASFSLDGKATLDFGLTQAIPYTIDAADVAVQADGKTVVAGTFRPADGGGDDDDQQDFAVARYNLDGTLDTAFGGGAGDHPGIVFAHVGKRGAKDIVKALAIGPDGKIVVVGNAGVARTLAVDTFDFAVIRLNADGRLDNSFDDDGMRTVRFAEDTQAIANDVAVKSDGTIIMVGRTFEIDVTPPTFSVSDSDFAVAILNPDGSLKSDGRRVFGFGGNETDDRANAVTVDPNGNIVVVGESEAANGSFAVARLLPSGAFDTSFGVSGRTLSPLPGRQDASATDVVMQGDKIVVVGQSETNLVRRSEMVRYLSNGLLDQSFGAGGNFVVETPGLDQATAIIRTTDGRLIVGGGKGNFTLAGYTANGVLDTTFGTGGTVTTTFDGTDNTLAALARGPGRRIVATGGTLAATARYLDLGANVVAAQPFTDATASEAGVNRASFFVFRQERLPTPTRVFFSIGGTATFNPAFGSDYQLLGMTGQTPTTGFVDIPAHETFAQVTLSPIDDRLAEGTERATFTILPSANYDLGTPAAVTLAILDNDLLVAKTTAATFSTAPALTTTTTTTATSPAPAGGLQQFSSVPISPNREDDDVLVILRA